MKFCKNCGHELRENAKVCTNCGTPVEQTADNTPEETSIHNEAANNGVNNDTTSQAVPTRSTEKTPKKKPNKKSMIIGGIILLLIAALLIAYFVLKSLASPDDKIDGVIEAVKKDDVGKLQSALDNEISDTEAKAYFAYIDDVIGKDNYRKSAEKVKRQVEAYNEGDIIDGDIKLLNIEASGKKWLLFDDYTLEIPKYKVEIEPNGLTSNVKAFKYKEGKNDAEWEVGKDFAELIPGKYSIDGVSTLSNDTTAPATIKTTFENGLNEDGKVFAELEGDFYFIKLINETLISNYSLNEEERAAFEKAVYKLNGKDVKLENTEDGELLYGPLLYDEEYELTGSTKLHGATIKLKPLKFNVNADTIDESGDGYDEEENIVSYKIEFNKDAIKDAQETKEKKDRAEQNYKDFKDNARDEIESFLYQYVYALEDMYDVFDYSEVDEFIADGSQVEGTLKNNVSNKNFANMYIYNIKFSHFTEDGDNYTIRMKSTRDHDDIKSSATFLTEYHLIYLKDEGRLVITNFVDL